MRADPPVRRDGRCAHCRGPRKLPKRLQKGVDPMHYTRDPFCSASCARAYHGNPLPVSTGGVNPAGSQGRYERAA